MTLGNIQGALPQKPAAADIETGGVSSGVIDNSFIGGNSVDKFDDSMRAANGVQYAQAATPGTVTDVTPVQTTAPVGETRSVAELDGATTANERAVQGLDLQTTTPAAEGPGETILNGLERIRGAFDSQLAGVTDNVRDGQGMDVMTVMNIQREVVEYSVLVDVSSKLAGKSTQALDTLMKGQ